MSFDEVKKNCSYSNKYEEYDKSYQHSVFTYFMSKFGGSHLEGQVKKFICLLYT